MGMKNRKFNMALGIEGGLAADGNDGALMNTPVCN
jgi:hypothetical protein